MSFILDALRKSEHERQRGAAPGVVHVPYAVPRERIPRWVFVVIGVLGVSVVALAAAWWNQVRAPARDGAAVAGETVGTPRSMPLELPTSPPPPREAPAPRSTLSAAVTPPTASGAREPARAAAPSRQEQSPPPAPATEPSVVAPPIATTVPQQPAAPIAPPPTAPTPRPAASAAPQAGATLPSPTALQAEGIPVPPLRLELHAYSDQPAQRFVFINGRRYREGERLTEGPELVAIEARGAVLSFQGRRFLLTPE